MSAALHAEAPRPIARFSLAELLDWAATAPPAAATLGYQAWIAGNPAALERCAAWFNLGVLLAAQGQLGRAMLAYQNALAAKPDFYQAAVNLGLAQEAQGQPEAALATWQQALQPAEARIALLNHRGRLLENHGRLAEAEAELRASLLLEPQQPDVLQHWSHLRQKGCIWPVADTALVPGLTRETLDHNIGPLGALAWTDDVALQRASVAAWLARKVAPAPRRLSPERGYAHPRIRLGYLSSDFCQHAMSFLIVELLERHDRTAFEVFGYCSSPEDGSALRARVLAALDHHVPVHRLSEAETAARIRADEIDILIDLNGLTKGARAHTLHWKPAPVQVTYLGYIGPLPLPELDYILCDNYVIPPEAAPLYAPKPLPLPGLYQANDSHAPDLPEVSRQQEGLPESGFVFCCFSNHYKLTEPLFDAWLGILHRVPGGVLWLAQDNATSHANLTERAARHCIAPERLVFAPRVAPARYLARMALADLFLDTFPYNAGTIASDALRMGLPVLTLSGQSFASRMAGSLVHAVGLAELATTSLADYTEAAVAIGTDAARHARLRAALAGDAWQRHIGDSAGFTARVEAAFKAIRLTP